MIEIDLIQFFSLHKLTYTQNKLRNRELWKDHLIFENDVLSNENYNLSIIRWLIHHLQALM